jgi:hypothetical protein
MPGISVLKFEEATVSPGMAADVGMGTVADGGVSSGGEDGSGGGDGGGGLLLDASDGGGFSLSSGRQLSATQPTSGGSGDGGGGGGGDGGGGRDVNLVRYQRDYLPDGKIWESAPIVGPLVKFQRETYMGCMLSEKGCADLLGAPKPE